MCNTYARVILPDVKRPVMVRVYQVRIYSRLEMCADGQCWRHETDVAHIFHVLRKNIV